MATYVLLANYTEQGIQNIEQSPARLEAAKQAFAKLGVEIKAFYLTMGRFDILAIIEAPDDERLASAVLALGSQGNVRTETLRAFPEGEFKRVVAALR